MTALFSASKGDWYTPSHILERVRRVLGQIDLDPASCAAANENVQATQFLTDGLVSRWSGRVFLNPPGTCPRSVETGTFLGCGNNKVCSCDLPRRFWNKLFEDYEEGYVQEAIFLGFSLNQLATLQDCPKSPLDYPICILRNRTKFLDPVSLEPVPGATQHNFITYMGPSPMKFRAEFKALGAVR